MSCEIIIKAAIKRREIFKNLEKHLHVIKEVITKLDHDAEVYLFGSVAENRYNYSSDIDVLIVTKVESSKVFFELWKSGIKEPFEIHVHPHDKAKLFGVRTKLIKI